MIKNISKYLALFIAVIMLVIFVFLGTTTMGLRLIITTAARFAPGELHIGTISGALNKVIIIKDFRYKNQGIAIRSPQLQLRVQPLALLYNQLYVSRLQTNALHITQFTQQSQQTKPTTPPKFNLPIKLRFKNIVVKQLYWRQDDKIHRLNNIMLQASIKSNHISISNLQSDVGQNCYLLRGELNLSPLRLELYFNQRQHQSLVLQGKINAYGNWKKLTVHSEINTPLPITTTMTINNLLTIPTWQLTGQIHNTNLKKFVKILDYKNASATFSGSGNSKTAQFSAKLMLDNNKTRYLTAHLNSQSLQQKQFAAILRWHNLALTDNNKQNINSPRGHISIHGKATNYTLSSNITVSGSKIPHGIWQLQGHGDLHHLTITDLKASTLKGSLSAMAHVNWQSRLRYDLVFNAKHLHPQQQWIDWYGDISLSGILKGDRNNIELSLHHLSGHLRQQPLHGSLRAHIVKHRLVTAISKISLGRAKLNFIFSKRGQLQTRWNINIPSLSELIPYSNGQLISKGQIKQTNSSPSIHGSVNGKNLTWHDYQLGTLNSDFKIAIDSHHASQMHLQATKIKSLSYKLNSLHFITAGTPQQHHINLKINIKQQSFHIQALGQYKNKRWQLHFTQFTLAVSKAKTWQLSKPFDISYAKNTFQLNNFSWHDGTKTIRANLDWQQQVLQKLHLNLHHVSLAELNPFLPNNINLQGRLNLQANYQQQKLTSGSLSADLQQGKIYYSIKNHEQKLIINSLHWRADLNKSKLNSLLKINLLNNNYLDVNLSSTDFKLMQRIDTKQHWRGELRAHLHDLKFLTLFFPALEMLNGQLHAQLKWNGTLKTPHLNGYASLHNGVAILHKQGLNIKAINFNATAAADRITYKLTATSGKGKLVVDGNSNLSKQHKTELQITGNHVTVANTAEYHIVARPNLHLLIQKNRLDLSGDLYLPTISINQRNYVDVITLPRDITTIRGADENISSTASNKLYAKIKLTLGKQVHFQNNYLDAQLSGSLLLLDNPKINTQANGMLTINKGTFTFYGQKLTIENGKLIYVGGPITNPGLDIEAIKTITTFVSVEQNKTDLILGSKIPSQQLDIPLQQKTIKVGAKITHTLEKPNIILFSDPAGSLSQQDILSYLIFGYPLNNARNGEAQLLLRLLYSLKSNKSSGENSLFTKIKQTLPFDQTGFTSDTYLNPRTNTVQQNMLLVLGKRLSPQFFVRYSIGLIEPINTLGISYQFNQYWAAQAKTNSLGKGVDLTYSREQK